MARPCLAHAQPSGHLPAPSTTLSGRKKVRNALDKQRSIDLLGFALQTKGFLGGA